MRAENAAFFTVIFGLAADRRSEDTGAGCH